MNVHGVERHEADVEEEGLTTADMAGTKDRSVTDREGQTGAPVSGAPMAGAPMAGAPQAMGTAAPQAMGMAAPAQPAPAQPGAAPSAPLFVEQEAQRFRARWQEIQTAFVDNPRQAVEQADHLVAETMKRLAEVFAKERDQLEQQWTRGDNVSTEDLRVSLQRYRSFFDRLLSV